MSANNYTTTGAIHAITEPEQAGESTKQSIILDVTDKPEYPTYAKFEFFGKLHDKFYQVLTGLSKGKTITLHWSISDREWNGKWFEGKRVWKIDTGEQAAPQPAQGQPAPFTPNTDDVAPF